jgi:hypothetical protein
MILILMQFLCDVSPLSLSPSVFMLKNVLRINLMQAKINAQFMYMFNIYMGTMPRHMFLFRPHAHQIRAAVFP